MAVGGQDIICVKQNHSSKVPPGDLRRHLENLGDFLFSDLKSPSQQQRNSTPEGKQKVMKYIYIYIYIYSALSSIIFWIFDAYQLMQYLYSCRFLRSLIV